MISNIWTKINSHFLNKKWRNFNFLANNIERYDNRFYRKHSNVREVEHQVGRFLSMKEVHNDILSNGLSGDILEFGTWKGLGLIYLSKIFKSAEIKYIAVDSFEGLPQSSTIWKKGSFNNTNEKIARDNILKYGIVGDTNLVVIKGWFDDAEVGSQVSKFAENLLLVHLDADLGVSTTAALDIIGSMLHNRKMPLYILFDDWGCHPDEVPDAFHNWVISNNIKFKFKAVKLSSTKLTRYYKLIFDSSSL